MAIPRSAGLCLLAISLALVCSSCGVCAPRPFISSISPGNTTAGGNQFVLTVNGNDFRRDSLVSWNGSFRVTTFVSSHQLEAAIAAADIAQICDQVRQTTEGVMVGGRPLIGKVPKSPAQNYVRVPISRLLLAYISSLICSGSVKFRAIPVTQSVSMPLINAVGAFLILLG